MRRIALAACFLFLLPATASATNHVCQIAITPEEQQPGAVITIQGTAWTGIQGADIITIRLEPNEPPNPNDAQVHPGGQEHTFPVNQIDPQGNWSTQVTLRHDAAPGPWTVTAYLSTGSGCGDTAPLSVVATGVPAEPTPAPAMPDVAMRSPTKLGVDEFLLLGLLTVSSAALVARRWRYQR